MTLGKITLVSALALTLAACGVNRLESVKTAPPAGEAFERALHAGYVRLAEMENAEYDWTDGSEFTDRAQLLSQGVQVLPEEVSLRTLPTGKAPVLSGARDRLMAALNAGGGTIAPRYAADAQVAFDCWMQELEENLQPLHIDACQAAFTAAMEKLEAAMAPKKPEKKMEKKAEPVAMAKPEPATVYFGLNSAKISAEGIDAIAQSIKAYQAHGSSNLMIVGHADKSGDAAYNQKLSERRVMAVKQALMTSGIPEARIMTDAKGESDPAVTTNDGVVEAKNRRVTIHLK